MVFRCGECVLLITKWLLSSCVTACTSAPSVPQVVVGGGGGCYGSCGSPISRYDSGFGSFAADEKTPLIHHARVGLFINIRIFSLGVLLIGGVTIGSYLIHIQSMLIIHPKIFQTTV